MLGNGEVLCGRLFGKRGATLFCLLALSAVVANADVSPVFLRIDASNGSGSGFHEILTSAPQVIESPPGTFTYQATGIQILNGGGSQIAMIDSIRVQVMDVGQITVTFALLAGLSQTTFSIDTATVSFLPPFGPAAQGAAGAGITLTDTDADLATLNGIGPNGKAFHAMYNGGTVFADYVDQINVLNPGGSLGDGGDTGGFVPIGSSVSGMTIAYDFTVTAQDSASSTSGFAVMPEPAGLALLALGAVLARRRA